MSNLIVTREWVEANPSLVTMRESKRYPGLFVLKYNRRVFYDNLWTPELEECRGLVVDSDFNVIVRPFKKVYNYGENGTTFERDAQVVYTRKVNGFLGCVTHTENHGLVFSTTGSLDSPFADMVAAWFRDWTAERFLKGFTYCFEICDESDPHIIKEDFGTYLIGCVHHETGHHICEELLDVVAQEWPVKRFPVQYAPFHEVVAESKVCKHEGFMVRLASDQSKILKLKSPYYLVKKFLARKSEEKLLRLLDKPHLAKQTIDEEYYPLVDYLHEHRVEYAAMDEQQRLKFIEEFLHG